MRFEENKSLEKLGVKAGFLFSYFLFSTILFGIFMFLNKLHEIGYFHIIGITLLITFTGIMIKGALQ